MTDYHPLLSRAVARLDENTSAARAAIFERARRALLEQLQSMTPPLSMSEIEEELADFADAVARLEATALPVAPLLDPTSPPEPKPERSPDASLPDGPVTSAPELSAASATPELAVPPAPTPADRVTSPPVPAAASPEPPKLAPPLPQAADATVEPPRPPAIPLPLAPTPHPPKPSALPLPSPIQPLSPARHGEMRWLPPSNFAFATARNLVPIAAAEVGRAALALPLAFIVQDGQWSLCALLGLRTGQNLYIGLEGDWLGGYVPAMLRTQPFHLNVDEAGRGTLCVDEASGLIGADPAGQPLFEGGEISPSVAKALNFLSETINSVGVLRGASALIAQTGIIEAWPITIQSETGAQNIIGLHRVNEAALGQISDADFLRLGKAGVLSLVYAQILSMNNMATLEKLAQARSQVEARLRAEAEVRAPATPMMSLPADSTIDWDWDRIGL